MTRAVNTAHQRADHLPLERHLAGRPSGRGRTPRLKRSQRASTVSPRACSGAMYAGVPTMTPGCVSADVVGRRAGQAEVEDLDARARLRRVGSPRSSQTLAGLMSRWIRPRSWAAASPRRSPGRCAAPPPSGSSALALEPVVERLALEELHGQERDAAILADLVDGDDVIVLDWRGRLRPRAGSARRPTASGGQRRQHRLEGDEALAGSGPRPGRRPPCRRRRAPSGRDTARAGRARPPTAPAQEIRPQVRLGLGTSSRVCSLGWLAASDSACPSTIARPDSCKAGMSCRLFYHVRVFYRRGR